MKYMVVLSYDGSKFYGFQRQKNFKSVQGYVERGLSELLGENIFIKGAGRTDRGVHATYQVVHFETDALVKNLKTEFNRKYSDVYIKKIKKVKDDFHARHSVKMKTYLYKIDLSNTLDDRYYLKLNYNIDIKKMQKASKEFIGFHDFHNFASGPKSNFETYIKSIRIYKRGKVLFLKFTGCAFYRYMVRNLVGALIEVGKGKVSIDTIRDMLNLKDFEKRLPTSSPNGLYLLKIRY